MKAIVTAGKIILLIIPAVLLVISCSIQQKKEKRKLFQKAIITRKGDTIAEIKQRP